MTTVQIQEEKEAVLGAIIRELGRVAVALSGGVDSSLLLAVCVDHLGAENVVAMTADSPLLPREELKTAQELATRLGVDHRILSMDELQIPEIANNDERRCYYCKRARFEAILKLTQVTGLVLLHGENADDSLDYRPGSLAAQELHVRAPLAEARLTKAEIRQMARKRGLPNWDRPAAACLASRFPYQTPLSREGLERVERAERELARLLGPGQLRVRDHYPVARIEVPPNSLHRLVADEMRIAISKALHAVGYRYVAVDLDGYRMGSLNEELT